jgi:hypothetical protein
VLRAIVEVVTDRAFEEPQAWATALPAIAHAYTHDVVYSGGFYHRKHLGIHRPNHDIPHIEARRICADAGAYPLSLVGTAEAILAAQTRADAIPVGKIAARDDWLIDG